MKFATHSNRWRGSIPFLLQRLTVAALLLAILPVLTVPTIGQAASREKETELKRALLEIRQAIASYKAAADAGRIKVELDSEGYPPDLVSLVEGVDDISSSGKATGAKLKFLPQIPYDPISGGREWGLHSLQDDPVGYSWGGQNVFDVYCISDAVASDGSKYRDW